MSVSSKIKFVQGDTLPAISAIISDRNSGRPGEYFDKSDPDTWAPIDLTGANVEAQICDEDGTVTDTFTVTIIEPVAGAVSIDLSLAPVMAAHPGKYKLEATVRFPGGAQQTVFDWLQIDVRQRFGGAD